MRLTDIAACAEIALNVAPPTGVGAPGNGGR